MPPRDLVVVFFADEEAGGTKGSHFMVAEHPEVFDGVTEAISEVGGYSVTVTDRDGDERRAYLLQTAEKGIAWLRLTAHGRAGHGSVPNDENAIVRLAEAISRIAAHKWPREFIPSVRTLLDGLSELTGTSWSDEDLDELLEHLGGAQGFVRGTLQDTSNVTMLDAGYKHNVIPQHASANVDCRFLPGHEDELMATIRDLAGEHVDVEVLHRDIALDAPFEGDLVEAMVAALRTEDPDAEVLPYCLSGGTDNKALSLLGITGLRVRAAAAAGRPRLRADVPRHRRAGAGRRRCTSARGCCCACSRPADAPSATAGVTNRSDRGAHRASRPDDAAAQPGPRATADVGDRALQLPAPVLGVLRELAADVTAPDLPAEGEDEVLVLDHRHIVPTDR